MHYLVFRFLAWLFPSPSLAELTPESESFEMIRKRYRGLDRWGGPVLVLAMVALAVYFDFLFSVLGTLTTQRFADAQYVLQCDKFDYRIMGVLLSFVSSTYLFFLALKWFLGRKEYDIYIAYYLSRLPVNLHAEKPFKWLFLLSFPPLVVLFSLWTTTFTALTDKAMFEAPFGSFGVTTERPYTDVRAIYFSEQLHARSEDIPWPQYVIVFKDGYRWKTKNPDDHRIARQDAMMRYVAKQSRTPIVRVKFNEDIPP